MTRQTAARISGFTLLFYIVVGIGTMAGAFHGAAREAAVIAQNVSAIVLAITLFAVTRPAGAALASAGLAFRVAEGSLGPILTLTGITLGRRSLVAALLFAIGSLCFCLLPARKATIDCGSAVVVSKVVLHCAPIDVSFGHASISLEHET